MLEQYVIPHMNKSMRNIAACVLCAFIAAEVHKRLRIPGQSDACHDQIAEINNLMLTF